MVMSALALFSYTIVPSWAFAIGSAFGLGFGCGLLDAAVNIYFAANHGSRLMNWLHASFGVGATLGPFIMSSSLLQTGSWQAGYVTTAMLQGCCAAFALALRNRWSMPSLNTQTTETSPRGLDTFRLAPVYTSIGIFICYTGVEMSIGQWAYPLFAEARNIPERQASTWLSVYWGAFTLGRIGFGFVGDHVPIAGILRGCLTAALVAGGFLVWNPFANAGLVSLALFGVAIAPIWAMLMLNTQRQVGAVHAPNAIGFQIAGAALGFGLLPGLAGLIARRSGLEWIPWLLILLVILMFALFEWNQHSNKAERLSAR
jgi:fucose permease